MYTRRKVFSLGENDNYDLYQSLYSEAFEDGVEYAERLFAENQEKNLLDSIKELPGKAKEKIINQWNKYAKQKGKGVNWKNVANRGAMVAALPALGAGVYGVSRLLKKKEKDYSEGFEDGFDYAQKMFAIQFTKDELNRLQAMTSELSDSEKEIMKNNPKQTFTRGLSKEDAIKRILGQRKDKGASLKEFEETRKQRAETAKSHVDPLAGKQESSVLSRKGQGLTDKEKKAIARMKENSNNGDWRANVYRENAEKMKNLESDVKGLTKNLKRWKIGAGVAGGLGALGAGYGLYNGLKSND